MRIINKADKYGEENKDYTLMIGDADIALSYKNEILWNWNFKSHTIQQWKKEK